MKNAFDSERGVQAIVSAVKPYVAHRAQWADVEDYERDRRAYNALQRACEASLAWFAGEWTASLPDSPRPSEMLLQALSAISPPSRMFDELIWSLQCQSIERGEEAPQSNWRDSIKRLQAFLRHGSTEIRLHSGTTLEIVRELHAASRALGSDNRPGTRPKPVTWRVWVRFAADAWQAASGLEPRGSDDSPFYQHLDEFQERGLADGDIVPRVGRRVVQLALKERADQRVLDQARAALSEADPPRDVDSAEWAEEFRARQQRREIE